MKFTQFIIAGILLMGGLNARAQVVEDALHFGVGYSVGAAGSFMASEFAVETSLGRISWSAGLSMVAGLFKEALDEYHYNGWSYRDLAFTILGGITAGVTIELWRSKRRDLGQGSKFLKNYPLLSIKRPVNPYLSNIYFTE